MTVLIIDTSKPLVWVALVNKGSVTAEREWKGDPFLGSALLEVVEELTGKATPDRIAVHAGPGHFMATRTGVITATLLAQGWGVDKIEINGNSREEALRQAISSTTLDTPS